MENNATGRPTSKQRVSRIPLNYHTRPDGFRRNRNRLTVVAAVLAMGLVTAIALSREWRNAGVSPGPVARVHMAYEHACSECHDSFTPIHEDARSTLTSIKIGIANSTASIETKCRNCHKTSQHHSHQIANKEGSCTSCHNEHRGEEVKLAETNDRTCTQCHSHVKDFIEERFLADLSPESESITSFPFQHPEFRSQASDPTRLKFNHQLHLSPGLIIEGERRAAWMLADVAPDDRAKYRRAKPADGPQDQSDEKTAVVLDCRDCHVSIADKAAGLGAGANASPLDFKNLPRNQPPLAIGAYMLPVKFADHCRGCHPLTVERSAPGDAHASEVPHGVQGAALRQLLAGHFWDKPTDDPAEQKKSPSRIRPLPGEAPGRLSRHAAVSVEQRVRQAETHLRDVACRKCHEPGDSTEPNSAITVAPVNMPAVWLQKSHFNHWAHRSVKDCQECHDAKSSTKTSDVLIKGIAKCRECHTPAGTSHASTSANGGSNYKAGADFRCVECHRYHRADLMAPDMAATGSAAIGAAATGAQGTAQPADAPSQEGNRASD